MIFILKKAVILYGSPKKNGNTKKLVEKLVCFLSNEYDFFLFDAYKDQVKPCYDCGLCKEENFCYFFDLDDLFQKIKESDLIILASPIYNMGFPAPLKAVLDRFQIYYNFKFRKEDKSAISKEKRAIAILVQGSKNSEYSDFLVKCLKEIFKSINASLEKKFILKGTDFEDCDIDSIYNKMKEEFN